MNKLRLFALFILLSISTLGQAQVSVPFSTNIKFSGSYTSSKVVLPTDLPAFTITNGTTNGQVTTLTFCQDTSKGSNKILSIPSNVQGSFLLNPTINTCTNIVLTWNNSTHIWVASGATYTPPTSVYGPGTYAGTGAPTITATGPSQYIRTDSGSRNQAVYVLRALAGVVSNVWDQQGGVVDAVYGTTSGTAAQGNDVRIINSLKYQGTYASGTTYVLNDVVSYSGSTYFSINASNTGHQPDTSGSYWTVLGGGGSGNLAAIATSGLDKDLSPYAYPTDTAPAATGTVTAYDAYGDSYTCGLGASITDCGSGSFVTNSTHYVGITARHYGLDPATSAVKNWGISGRFACDINNEEVFASARVATTNAHFQTLFAGINDGLNITNPLKARAGNVNYNNCMAASIAWLTTAPNRYIGSSFSSVPTNWSLDTYYAGFSGLKSSTNAASSVWPVTVATQGQTIFIFYHVKNGNYGTATYSGCGFSGTISSNPDYPIFGASNSNLNDAEFVIPLSSGNTTAGSCNITISVTSPTDSNKVVQIGGVGVAPPMTSSTSPRLFMFGIPSMEPQTLSTSASGLDLFNRNAKQLAKLYRSYGVAVNFVDTQKCFANLTNESTGDTIHPGDVGYSELAACLLKPTYWPAAQPIFDTEIYPTKPDFLTVSTSSGYPTCKTPVVRTIATTTLTLPSCTVGDEMEITNQGAGTITNLVGPTTANIAGYAGSFPIPGLTFARLKYDGTYWTVIDDNARKVNPSSITFTLGTGGGGGATAVCAVGAVCTAQKGRVTFTSGTSPSGGWLFSVNDSSNWSSANVTCSGVQQGGTTFLGLIGNNANNSGFELDSQNAPVASTAYSIDYTCSIQ